MPALPPILFEDAAVLAFDKPSGQRVAAERGDHGGATLMSDVRASRGADVANVHRLDREASGVLLCAKTKAALDVLSGQFQSKSADKRYLALVPAALPGAPASERGEGETPIAAPAVPLVPAAVKAARGPDGSLLDAFAVELSIADDAREPGRMRVSGGRAARECLTEFKVLERLGRWALVEARPVTGRPHQLRVHLAAIGAPVLNDRLYGDPSVKLRLSDLKRGYKGREEEKPLLTRLALHASELTVKHPTTREPLVVRAPLPDDFEIPLKYLRKFAAWSPGRR